MADRGSPIFKYVPSRIPPITLPELRMELNHRFGEAPASPLRSQLFIELEQARNTLSVANAKMALIREAAEANTIWIEEMERV